MSRIIELQNNRTNPNSFISCRSLSSYKPFKRIDIVGVIRILVAMGYIETNSKPPHTAKDPAVELTQEGQCYFEVERDKFWHDVRTKAVIPIIVALLTTVITLIIASLI